MDQIKKTLDSGSGQALKKYLLNKLDELKSIDSIADEDTEVEIKAQKRAYLKLKEILQEIMTFSETISKKDPRDNFGIRDEDIT